MTKLLALLVVVLGCGRSANTCGDTARGEVEDSFALEVDLGRQVTEAITTSCVDDHWPQDAIDCLVDEHATGNDLTAALDRCAPRIGASYVKLDKKLSELAAAALAKQFTRLHAARAAILRAD